MIYCSICNRKLKIFKPETAGIFLIIFIIPFIYFFGINAGSVVGTIMLFSVGLYWLITKPSKKFIC